MCGRAHCHPSTQQQEGGKFKANLGFPYPTKKKKRVHGRLGPWFCSRPEAGLLFPIFKGLPARNRGRPREAENSIFGGRS